MNSALRRARATLADHQRNQQLTTTDGLNGADRELLNRSVAAQFGAAVLQSVFQFPAGDRRGAHPVQ